MSDNPDQSPAVDFDRLLESVDPGFTKSLEDLNHIKSADVDISADVLDLDGHVDGDDDLPSSLPGGASLPARLRYVAGRAFGLLVRVLGGGLEFGKYAAHGFKRATRAQKALGLLMIAIFATVGYLVFANLRGTWLPSLNAPIIGQLAPYADPVADFDQSEKDLVDLNLAFPAEVHEFLFRRFKVNLRPTPDNPQPMGAFEFVLSADTKETAIEVRDREVEFGDALERLFEDQTFNDLATELGKAQLKNRIQGAVNERLSAGRVTAVNFRTFILKP